jgi:hypothetical protein
LATSTGGDRTTHTRHELQAIDLPFGVPAFQFFNLKKQAITTTYIFSLQSCIKSLCLIPKELLVVGCWLFVAFIFLLLIKE